MPCRSWLYAGWNIIELQHGPMKQVRILLNQFHRFQFFDNRLCRNLIYSFTSFFFKMTGISNISYIAHFIPEVQQVPVNDIKGDKRPCMTKMTFATYCWSADIHTNMTRGDWLKFFLLP